MIFRVLGKINFSTHDEPVIPVFSSCLLKYNTKIASKCKYFEYIMQMQIFYEEFVSVYFNIFELYNEIYL